MPQETHATIRELVERFESADLDTTLRGIVTEFGSSVSLACSFGVEDMVLLDALLKVDSGANVFVLDTGRLHEETYDLMERCRVRYGVNFEVYAPDTRQLQDLLRLKGPNSFYSSVENRQECCSIRKVEPLRRALAGRRAWITGQRREQAVTRLALPKVQADDRHEGVLKFNPLAEWTQAGVWRYIRSNDVPYNALHDRGFPSIGCAPCTRAVLTGEDVRAGRWWWETPEQKECGLHSRRA